MPIPSESRSRSWNTGNMLLKMEFADQMRVQYVGQALLQLRLYPDLSRDGRPLPMRSGKLPRDVGAWITDGAPNDDGSGYIGVAYVGGGDGEKTRIRNMLLTIRGDEALPENQQRGVSVWRRIVHTVRSLTQTGTAPTRMWYVWAADRDDDSACLSPRRTKLVPYCFARGLVTFDAADQKPSKRSGRGTQQRVAPATLQNPRMNCLFYFSPNALDAIRKIIMAQRPDAVNYHGDDMSAVFRFNALTDLNGGHLIQFGPVGQTSRHGDKVLGTPFIGCAGGSMDPAWLIEATVLEALPPKPVSIDDVRKYAALPISDIVQVWEDERALIAALAVGIPDEVMIYSFANDRDWLPPRLQVKASKILSQGPMPAPNPMPWDTSSPPAASPLPGWEPPGGAAAGPAPNPFQTSSPGYAPFQTGTSGPPPFPTGVTAPATGHNTTWPQSTPQAPQQPGPSYANPFAAFDVPQVATNPTAPTSGSAEPASAAPAASNAVSEPTPPVAAGKTPEQIKAERDAEIEKLQAALAALRGKMENPNQ